MEFSQVNLQELQIEHSIEVDKSTGSAVALVDIPLPDGRNGFGPDLSMVYSSSSKNSCFGIGWNLDGLTYISIDTKDGLPKYDGSEGYSFNGTVQLVPQLVSSGGDWAERTDSTSEHWIFYYREKFEGSFTRYEKWVAKASGAVHWIIRSKLNMVSVYGADPSGITRIYNPENPDKVFIWLLEAQYDNSGNSIKYIYKQEDDRKIDPVFSYESSRVKRFGVIGFSQKYPERILYANSKPIYQDKPVPIDNQWLYEVVFDYGQYGSRPYNTCQPQEGAVWDVRPDPFSIYSAGFEVRTYRLCRRVLIFNHFKELQVSTSLTGIFECQYNESESGTTLGSIIYTGIRRDLYTGEYSEKSLPALTFTYTAPSLGQNYNMFPKETYENLPQGLNHSSTCLIDLLGEGFPGLLCETSNNWYYKSNLGNGRFDHQQLVLQKPSQNLGIYSLGDFEQNGNLKLFTLQGRMAGYYEYDRDNGQWSGFNTFDSIPQVDRAKFFDINSDGYPDLIIEYDDIIVCYEFKGRKGFAPPYELTKANTYDGSYAPLIGDNPALGYFMADMTGDGLLDQVYIKNNHVEYYPNLGNGHFGEAVLMEAAPVFDYDSIFDADRIRFYDLDGSGTSDVLYIGNGYIQIWQNASGNRFIDKGRITGLPCIDNTNSVVILDILGNGLPCLVWSNSNYNFQGSPIQYLELTNGIVPRLLVSADNGMGKEVTIEYGYSGAHYLEAKNSGRPWISKLPSHFTVVDKKTMTDHVTNSRLSTHYKYYNGQYDGNKRSFVTFGLVEQFDTELFNNKITSDSEDFASPSCTRTWFHGGIPGWDVKRASQFYDKDASQPFVIQEFFEQTEALDAEDYITAYQSLAGRVLRQEVFAASIGGIPEEHPYQISQLGYCIRKLQPVNNNNTSCFFAYQTETLNITYEQNPEDPRVSHSLSVKVNDYGDIEKEINISYARREAVLNILPAQSRDYITAGVNQYYYNDSIDMYLSGILFESRDFEINTISHQTNRLVKLSEIRSGFDGWINDAVSFDRQLPNQTETCFRLISWDRTYYWNNDFTDSLPLGQIGSYSLVHHEETACFTNELIDQVYAGKVTKAMLSAPDEGNYIFKNGYWWQHTDISHFNMADGFYSISRSERDGRIIAAYKYDSYYLSIIETTDALGSLTKGIIDYNLLEPYRLVDPNDNVTEVLYDPLGVAIVNTHQGNLLDEAGILQRYGFDPIKDYVCRSIAGIEGVLADPAYFLQQTQTFLYYELDTWKCVNKPLRSIQLVRENLKYDGKGNIDDTPVIQIEVNYQDGFGRTIQEKCKVEAGPSIHRKADGTIDLDSEGKPVLSLSDSRWLVSGHVTYNNKQLPVRQFEPFFSDNPEYESDARLQTYGVSVQNHYDPVSRLIRTDLPDGTFTEGKFTPWEIQSFDQNDTIDRSQYKSIKQALPSNDPERLPLDKSLAHKDTPVIVCLDPLGREIVEIQKNNDGTEKKVETRKDINGNNIEIVDARHLKAFEYKIDMPGRLLSEMSVDAGSKYIFHDNSDNLIHMWDGRDIHQRTGYDLLDRIISVQVDGVPGLDQVMERYQYGEDPSIIKAKERNLRGQLVKHYDQAGTLEVKAATPEGKPVAIERKLVTQYMSEPNWTDPAAVALEAEAYVSEYTYDALDRCVLQKLPDRTLRKFIFNEGGGIKKILVSTADGKLDEAEILRDVSYDAKGFRQAAVLGNDVNIVYTYDPNTFRLSHLQSKKSGPSSRVYQDIRYTYDPVGNLIYSIDEAQEPLAPSPKVIEGLNVSSHSEFEYDALYQLKTAKGRVHQSLNRYDYADRSREADAPDNWGKGTRHISLNNGAAVERYCRSYKYDIAGNRTGIRHQGATQSWTEEYWISASSNRSLPDRDMNGLPINDPESCFDPNGNCTFLPNLRSVIWNYRNNIARAVIIDRTAEGKPNDEEYYVYGGDGLRIRKITQRVINADSCIVELTEKIYLSGCEIKRIILAGEEVLKRYTSHITDGINSIAMIHSWEKDKLARETNSAAMTKIHYQLGNHIGSVALELDENADIISYEEYLPFGGTSFIAGRSRIDIELKDYRYSGKERDDFTGFYYFGYRYYAHWLGGWLSPDPLGPEDSENLYLYVHNNPVNLSDPNGLKSNKGKVIYVDNSQEAEAYRVFRSNLTLDTLKKYIKEGRTSLYYNTRTGVVTAVTKEEGEALMKSAIERGENFTIYIEKQPEPEQKKEASSQETEADTRTVPVDSKENTSVTEPNNTQIDGEGGNTPGIETKKPGKGAESSDGEAAGIVKGVSPGLQPGGKGGERGSKITDLVERSKSPGTSDNMLNSQIGGPPGDVSDGQNNGDPNDNTGGSPGGSINGRPDGMLDGMMERGIEGENSQSGENGSTQPPQKEGQNKEQGTQDGTKSNWLDTAARWAGYLNLEFGGGDKKGEAGGVPGGMDLFGWRPSMWVKRTLQAVFVVTSVVTAVLAVGKAAIVAKAAIQKAMQTGLKATARKLLLSLKNKIPTRESIKKYFEKIIYGENGKKLWFCKNGKAKKTDWDNVRERINNAFHKKSTNPEIVDPVTGIGEAEWHHGVMAQRMAEAISRTIGQRLPRLASAIERFSNGNVKLLSKRMHQMADRYAHRGCDIPWWSKGAFNPVKTWIGLTPFQRIWGGAALAATGYGSYQAGSYIDEKVSE